MSTVTTRRANSPPRRFARWAGWYKRACLRDCHAMLSCRAELTAIGFRAGPRRTDLLERAAVLSRRRGACRTSVLCWGEPRLEMVTPPARRRVRTPALQSGALHRVAKVAWASRLCRGVIGGARGVTSCENPRLLAGSSCSPGANGRRFSQLVARRAPVKSHDMGKVPMPRVLLGGRSSDSRKCRKCHCAMTHSGLTEVIERLSVELMLNVYAPAPQPRAQARGSAFVVGQVLIDTLVLIA